MPKYATTRRRKAATARKKAVNRYTRDKRILKRWAAHGTKKDYAKLRRVTDSAPPPEYVLPAAVDELGTIDRRRMVELLHQEPHGGSWFMDALNWVLSLPAFKKGPWISKLVNLVTKPFKGDGMTETDEDYAKLVDATYRDDRPEMVEHWRRMPELDGQYCSAWESADGHVVIAVRGTKLEAEDIGQDLLIAATNQHIGSVADEFRKIVAHVPADKIIDVASHSLGTSLTLSSFEEDPDLYKRVNQTYLYNPAASPVAQGTPVTEKYLQDSRVRYFINLSDAVSSGLLTQPAPVNVVYRTGSPLRPLQAHGVGAWYPGSYDELSTQQLPNAEDAEDYNSFKENVDTIIDPLSQLDADRDHVREPDRGTNWTVVFGDESFGDQLEQIQGWAPNGGLW
jgi:hypothetical protein